MSRKLLLSVIVPFAAGFFLAAYYRFVNAVLSPRLVAELHLNASELGLLTSIYFFTAAIFQAPLGLLIDRYGPRRVQGTMIAIAAIGVLGFALGRDEPTLIVARAIMGIGGAGALMTSFQAIILWFPAERRPLLNGLVLSIGGLGSLAATLPTELLLQGMDWRQLMLAVAAASFAVSGLIFVAVPEKPEAPAATTVGEQIAGMALIYRDRLFWRIAPMYAVTVGAMFAFQGLWAAPWLKDVAGLATSEVAGDLLAVNVLQTGCYVGVGWLATRLARRGVPLTTIVACGSFLFILSQTTLLLPTGAGRWVVLFGMGCLANINLLLYPVLAGHFPAQLMGRANTALNLFVFVGAFVVQSAVGVLIDLTPAAASGGYPPSAYQFAFAILVAVEAIAWAWFVSRRAS